MTKAVFTESEGLRSSSENCNCIQQSRPVLSAHGIINAVHGTKFIMNFQKMSIKKLLMILGGYQNHQIVFLGEAKH